MDLGLKGKTALVAGASGGLGFAVARELAAEGADLVICSRSEANIDKAREALLPYGGRVLGLAADLDDAAARARLVKAALDRMGGIDILVTNTGGPPPGPFESHPADRWLKTVDAHLGSALDLCRAVLPGMRERRWGRIITITSIAVKQPVNGLILSNTARAAVVGFARSLANEVAAEGITVNNVMPGYTLTDRVTSLSAKLAAERGCDVAAVTAGWEAEIPMRRLGTVEEFAGLVAYLASGRASYITGTSIPVDGGWIRSLL